MKIPILETERLILRPLSLEDVSAVQKYFNDWDIVRFTTAPWPYDPETTKPHIEEVLSKVEQGEEFHWAIVLKETEKFIGRIDYRGLKSDEVDRGFWIAKPFQGQGYMGEAVAVTQDYMFVDYGLDGLVVKNLVDNEPSSRIKNRYGGIFLGLEEPCNQHSNEKIEVWEITKESWFAAKKKLKG